MKKSLKITAAVVFLAALVWSLVVLYQKSFPPPAAVALESPSRALIARKAVATGSILPRKEVDIKPRISGIVQEILVRPGDTVKAGDVLARIKVVPNMASLREAELRLRNAELSLEDARREETRVKKLFETGVVPDRELQAGSLRLARAKDEQAAAEDGLRIIRDGMSGKTGDPSNTTIRSTIAGMVLSVPVTEGRSVTETNTFSEGTTIATVADMSRLMFVGKIDEADVGRLKEGMEMTLSVGALGSARFAAQLERIAPKGVEERGSMQFEIRAAFEQKEGTFIRAGYSATAEIVLDKREDALSVPEALLQFKDGKPYVEVEKEPGVFEKRGIETGLSDGIRVEVVSGLAESDRIRPPEAGKI